MKILVTGATGFIGRHLAALLHRMGHQLVLPTRGSSAGGNGHSATLGGHSATLGDHSATLEGHSAAPKLRTEAGALPLWPIADMNDEQAWLAALEGVDVVVHLAGRAHVLQEQGDATALFHAANVALPLMLARLAAQSGVRRFVFVSSIGVMGPARATPFRVDDEPAPRELYAKSKWAAEQALKPLCAEHALALTIVRPPLVYGPAAPGNFGRLLKLAALPLPLPLGAVHNQRSFVSVQNLVDLLARCCEHPGAVGQTFLVSDGEDISTSALLRQLRQLQGKPAWLIPLPLPLLSLLCRVSGQAALQEKLLDSLQIDQQHTCQSLAWQPPLSVAQGLALAVKGAPAVTPVNR